MIQIADGVTLPADAPPDSDARAASDARTASDARAALDPCAASGAGAAPDVSAETPGRLSVPVQADPAPAPVAPVGGEQNDLDPETARRRARLDELERLGDEIAELAAHLHAATFRLLERLREFDRCEGWSGFQSCAHWLSWRTGISAGPAREKVRVARALEELPLIGAAMARGELSYSKVRALTRIATPANEARLMDFAAHATAGQTERLVSGWRKVDRLEAAAELACGSADGAGAAIEARLGERLRHESRQLRLWQDDDGSFRIEGRLDPEVGAMLAEALEMADEALFRKARSSKAPSSEAPSSGSPEDDALASGQGNEPSRRPSYPQRRADALGLVAEAALQSGIEEENGTVRGRADRFQIVLHRKVPESSEAEAGSAEEDSASTGAAPPAADGLDLMLLPDSLRVSAETSRRIACDAATVVVTHGCDGCLLDIGRRSRVVPVALQRALAIRDGGCRFPGCASRFCDAHHIHHWVDGGPTKLDNLVLLCRRHHRAVHEEGYRVEVVDEDAREGTNDADRTTTAHGIRTRPRFRFRWPDGRVFPNVPPAPSLPARPETTLRREHAALGVEPDGWTAAPRRPWGAVDAGYALSVMRLD